MPHQTRTAAPLFALLSLRCSPPCCRVVLQRQAHQKKKLVVWGLQYGAESQGLRARVAEFERRHPDVEVSISSMGAGGMNPQKLMTAIVGNVPPDVIWQDRFTIGDWASRDTFTPLDTFYNRDKHLPDSIQEENYYPACWQEANYTDPITKKSVAFRHTRRGG